MQPVVVYKLKITDS